MYRMPDALPDIVNQSQTQTNTTHTDANHTLEWVGMEKIGLPIQLLLSDGSTVTVAASADVFVSLDTSAKGIHMSRLYLKLNEILANKAVTLESLNVLLDSMLQSHVELSESARLKLTFDIPLKKKALLSDNYGYQLYPVEITQQLREGKSETTVELTIPYSSTCPCSTSLANQIKTESFANKFPGEMVNKDEVLNWFTSEGLSLATPHNQRSYAYIRLDLSQGHWLNIDEYIFQLEQVIGTPVQTAVKREDEQEFARLNGGNLMFCEDAARRVKRYLETLDNLYHYWFKIEHQESLHAHNAVVIDSKRVS